MGLFSKKKYTCSKCGKEFEKRINLNGSFCDDCYKKESDEKKSLLSQINGYNEYHKDLFFEDYSSEDMKKIIEHKNRLLEKFKISNGISKDELQNVSYNYHKLTDEEAIKVLERVSNSMVSVTLGSVYGKGFFIPSGYDNVIVDANDVFAVAYTSDYKLQSTTSEVILCAVFTNDPYIPVFPMIYLGKIGAFELTKSKKGRQSVEIEFNNMCHNLKYPVMDLKHLKKQIKQENCVNGNLELKFMLDRIFDASTSSGIFNTKKMTTSLLPGSNKMLEELGYIQQTDMSSILRMDKRSNQKYWLKQIDKFAEKKLNE